MAYNKLKTAASVLHTHSDREVQLLYVVILYLFYLSYILFIVQLWTFLKQLPTRNEQRSEVKSCFFINVHRQNSEKVYSCGTSRPQWKLEISWNKCKQHVTEINCYCLMSAFSAFNFTYRIPSAFFFWILMILPDKRTPVNLIVTQIWLLHLFTEAIMSTNKIFRQQISYFWVDMWIRQTAREAGLNAESQSSTGPSENRSFKRQQVNTFLDTRLIKFLHI